MTLEEITPAWLTAALRTKAAGVTVRHAEILQVNRGTCTKIRLRLDMDEAGRSAGIPEQVILKGGFEPHSRERASLHDREVRGYNDVFSPLSLPSPACYFARYNAEQQQGIVIMEDLTLRGVEFCTTLRPQTFEQVATRLTVLAHFHAQTWNSPELKHGRWRTINEGLPAFRSNFVRRYCHPEIWKKFLDLPRGAACSVRFHRMEWAIETLSRLERLSGRLPHVVLHGDAHPDNMYIDANGAPGFFDPMTHRDHAMRDVAYYICSALDSADRRRWEGPLLQHYLDELRCHGVDAPSFDEALRIYGAYLALGFLIFLCNDTLFQPEAINTANAARFSIAMVDHDTQSILDAIE